MACIRRNLASKGEEMGPYLKLGQEGCAKSTQNVVDLSVKLIGTHQRTPAFEDGVRNL